MTRQEAIDILDGRNTLATEEQQIEAHEVYYGVGGFYDEDLSNQALLLPPKDPPYAPPQKAQIIPVDPMSPGFAGSGEEIAIQNFDFYLSIKIYSPSLAAWTRMKELYGSYLAKYKEGSALELPPGAPYYRVPISLQEFLKGFHAHQFSVGFNAPFSIVRAAIINPFDYQAALDRKKKSLESRTQGHITVANPMAEPVTVSIPKTTT